MAKKAAAKSTADDELMKRPSKQSFVKLTKNKKENPRTWVVIYRLVDGPPVDTEKTSKQKSNRKKKESE